MDASQGGGGGVNHCGGGGGAFSSEDVWCGSSPAPLPRHAPAIVLCTRFTLAPDTIYVKLAALSDGTCTGLAPGSAIATLDAEAAATFMVTDEGLYDICIQHRTNWEPVANTKFDVRAQILGQPQVYGTPTLFGYNTCESMLKVLLTPCYPGQAQAGHFVGKVRL